MTITVGKAIAGESAYVGLVSASSGVTLEEKDGGVFVIPEGTTTSEVDGNVATQIGYTVSNTSIVAGTERDAKEKTAAEESKNKLNEEVAKNDAYYVRIGTSGYATLQSAASAAAEGDTIYIVKDIAYDGKAYGGSEGFVSKTITVDLNNHTVSNTYSDAKYNGSGLIFDGNQAEGTIKNGTITSAKSTGIYVADGYKLTIDNCTVTTSTTLLETNYTAAVRITETSSVTINSGTYTGYYSVCLDNVGSGSSTDVSATINGGIFNGLLRITDCGSMKKAALTINGGTFNGGFDFASVDGTNVKVTIKGGTFNTDPSAYVDTSNFKVTQSGSTWIVSAK